LLPRDQGAARAGTGAAGNADAERWIDTVRRAVLDRMRSFGRRQLQSVLAEYANHDNVHRPRPALGQVPPLGLGIPLSSWRLGASSGEIASVG
jgi:hypothetical protein